MNRHNIICTAVNKDYLFAGSNLNFISYLTRVKFEDKSVKELTFHDEHLTLVVTSDRYVIVFLTSLDHKNMYSKINIYDIDSLKLKKSIDITEFGINQSKYYLGNNTLYFTNSYDKNDEATNVLGILNLNDFSLSKVILECDYPDDIQYLSDNTLLISCTDVVQSDGTKIILFNIDTGKQMVYDLNVPILNVKVVGNKLFVLTSSYNLNVYKIDNDMKLIKSIQHELTKGNYCSTLFASDK